MKNKNSSLFLKLLIIFGVLLFAVIAFVIVDSKKTMQAVVPNVQIPAGTVISESMLEVIRVPVDTPKGYITDKNSLIGQKVKTTVEPNQLLYVNSIMASWDDFSDGTSIPDDYVVTAIRLPSERAVGGLITVGDTIDILGVPNATWKSVNRETLAYNIGGLAEDCYGTEDGINLYWVLANVKVLETNSELSDASESGISAVIGEASASREGAYYIVALSYADYLKLRLAEQYLDLWANICPEASSTDIDAMLELMKQQKEIQSLKDSQDQSIYKEEESDDNVNSSNKQ